jgi:hypothetical protein
MIKRLPLILAAFFVFTTNTALSQMTQLYVDTKTKQVFTEPAKGREPLNLEVKKTEIPEPVTAPVTVAKSTEEKKWYDKLSLRGYTQFRTTFASDDDDVKTFHPADKSVVSDQTFLIRRGRLILSGDVSDHLSLYIQPDLNASPSDGDFSVQLRDAYADIALDADKEFRVRVGQSKVPFGFVNLQSSQNRLAIERPDALNSAVEGERDVGAYLYWAPKEIRERFKLLVADGLKGSGDYGVFGIGLYDGQGLNRTDVNDNKHAVARLSYPFKFANGQYFEPGLQAYTGKYVPRTREISVNGDDTTPSFDEDGVNDSRAGLTAVLYPQPIGFEAEWNVGKGPELSDDYTKIDDSSLNGGYFLVNAKIDTSMGTLYPFVRWQYFDGGRKFGRNSPSVEINEWDVGVEFLRWQDVELTGMYTFANTRTNSNDYSYEDITKESRFALQVQVNY